MPTKAQFEKEEVKFESMKTDGYSRFQTSPLPFQIVL